MIQLNDYNTCIICLENINFNSYILNCCNTYYHFKCIKKWINTNNSCPHCRKTIVNSLYNIPENTILQLNISSQNLNVISSPLHNFIINHPYINIFLFLCIEIIIIFFMIYLIMHISYN